MVMMMTAMYRTHDRQAGAECKINQINELNRKKSPFINFWIKLAPPLSVEGPVWVSQNSIVPYRTWLAQLSGGAVGSEPIHTYIDTQLETTEPGNGSLLSCVHGAVAR